MICAVNGWPAAAFYMLAEADIIIAAEHATFFDPHVTYGMAAVYEPMKMLQQYAGRGVAHDPAGYPADERRYGSSNRAGERGVRAISCSTRWVADAIASQPPVGVQASLRHLGATTLAPSRR